MDTDTQAQVPQETPVTTDTAQAPISEADVQAIETPEAAEVQETAVNAEDTVAEKLYAGKYKNVEDLEKSYSELQSKFTETTQQKAELSRILADAFNEPAATPAVTADYDEYSDEIPVANPVNDVVTRKVAVMEFSMAHPDADGAAMLDILKSDPAAQRIPDYEAKLKYAYAMSRITAQPKVVEEAARQAQVQTQVKIAEKQAAQVESASRQAPPTQEEPLTQEQLRSALRDDKAFGDILKKRKGFSKFVS